jgi:hypothetical protein
MSEDLKERITTHTNRSVSAGEMSSTYGSPTDATWALVRAVHDLGITTAMAAQTARVDETEIEQLGRDVSAIGEIAREHREILDKVMKGMAPWGQLKEACVKLERAVAKVTMR